MTCWRDQITCETDRLAGISADSRLRDFHLGDVIQVTGKRAARYGHAPVAQLHVVTSNHVTCKLRLVHAT